MTQLDETTSIETGDRAPASQEARRIPAQKRSQRKLEKVMEVATRLVIEGDPQAITTTTIAGAADISVGWIYRYFPDKEAIFDRILVESLERLDKRLAEVNFSLDVADWRTAVENGIETIVDFVADDAAFRKLWFSNVLTVKMVEANREHDTNLAKQLSASLPPIVDGASTRRATNVTEMFLGIIDKGVDLAFRTGDPRGDRRIVAEMKFAAVRYLESFLA